MTRSLCVLPLDATMSLARVLTADRVPLALEARLRWLDGLALDERNQTIKAALRAWMGAISAARLCLLSVAQRRQQLLQALRDALAAQRAHLLDFELLSFGISQAQRARHEEGFCHALQLRLAQHRRRALHRWLDRRAPSPAATGLHAGRPGSGTLAASASHG